MVKTEVGAVLHNTDNGATFSTNLVGARIWKDIAKGLTENEIIDEVSSEFGVARDQVCGDVEEFLKDLEQKGLLLADATEA